MVVEKGRQKKQRYDTVIYETFASVETYFTFMSNFNETQDEKYGNAKEIINAVQYETSDKRTPLIEKWQTVANYKYFLFMLVILSWR